MQTTVQAGPPAEITDSKLLENGLSAHQLVFANPESSEDPLFPEYALWERKFFAVGRVFMMLWAEPAGANSSVTSRQITVGIHGESVHQQIRRFIVVRECGQYCTALPITTYGGRGVAKRGMKKSEHVVVYSENQLPAEDPGERPERGEAAMRRETVRILTDRPTESLDPMSRLDLARAYTIQHNIKARSFGMVQVKARASLESAFSVC